MLLSSTTNVITKLCTCTMAHYGCSWYLFT